MPSKHATLSASGSAKWLACPGALALEALIDIPDEGSAYSREGTAAHSLLEHCLKTGMQPSRALNSYMVLDETVGDHIAIQGEDGNPQHIKITQDMVNAVEVAVEYVGRLQARNAFYEERLDYSHIAPGGFGTGDIILEVMEKVAPGKRVNTLYVIDYKHGKGIRVDAFENSQGLLYGLGALNSLEMLFEREIERVIIVILQPRKDNISEYEISVEDLNAWGEKIKPQAQLAHSIYDAAVNSDDDILGSALDRGILLDPKSFNPTEKGCQWCAGKKYKRCKAQAAQGYEAAVEGFGDLTADQQADLPSIEVSNATVNDPMLMSSADLGAVYKSMSVFLRFADELDEEIRSRIKSGELLPGLKLVDTVKKRSWKLDEVETIKHLRTAGLQKKHYEIIKTISPTQAEKLIKEIRPKEARRRYKKLELSAIHRPAGPEKIVIDNSIEDGDFDDLLG